MPQPSDTHVLFLIPGFHFDPVWWNTQAHYVETGRHFPPEQGSAFQLLRSYVEACGKDPDYRFVIDQIPVLKPFLDSQPEALRTLRKLIDQQRVEIVGASYNQLQSTLIGLEAQLRNLAYGILYEQEITGIKPAVAWQLDVFGHDPSFPQLLASCGVPRVALARGPFHQWSPPTDKQNLPSEFHWLACDGSHVLAHFMPAGYFYGWRLFYDSTTVQEAAQAIRRMTEELGPVAATRSILVPLGADFARPIVELGETVRHNERQADAPRARIATASQFFDDIVTSRPVLRGMSRDLGPIYTGVAVSYADLKIAERRTTNALLDAECWAALASSTGAAWPAARLDHAWRRLLFGAHHDAVTGSCSDQVYIDLVYGWRAAHDTAQAITAQATSHLAARIDTQTTNGSETAAGVATEERALVVFNSMSFTRTDELTADLPAALHESLAGRGVSLEDKAGRKLACSIEKIDEDRSRLHCIVSELPPLGYRTFFLRTGPDAARGVDERQVHRPTTIENAFYSITVDPSRGGTILSLRDLRSGDELLRPGGALANELVFHDEYSALPDHGEGPWHISPTGRKVRFREASVSVRIRRDLLGEHAIVTGAHAGVRFCQRISLLRDVQRGSFTTQIHDFTGENRLLRVHFPLARRGRRPMCETATGVVGRSFSRDVDSADSAWTLDMTAQRWAGLAAPLMIDLGDGNQRAVGVAELVLPAAAGPEVHDAEDALARALTRLGVPTTPTNDTDRRFGDLEYDSHLPDLRIVLGGPALNGLAAKLFAALDQDGRARWEKARCDPAVEFVWIETPGRPRVAVLLDRPQTSLAAAARRAARRLATAGRLTVRAIALDPDEESAVERAVVLLNRGTPSYSIYPSGDMALALFRSCPSWPAGHWVDRPTRSHPDGSSFALQHWNHHYEYALLTTDRDPRLTGLTRVAASWNRPPIGVFEGFHQGKLPRSHSFVTVTSDSAHVTAVKRGGFFGIENLFGVAPRGNRLVLRLLETSGQRRNAEIECALPAVGERRLDPLEQPRPTDPASGRSATLSLGPHAIETVAFDLRDAAPALEPIDPGPHPSRYWMVNEGAAPEGFMPFSVFLEPRSLSAKASTTVTLQVLVSNARRDRPFSGTLTVEGPCETERPLLEVPIELEPGGFKRKRLTVALPDDPHAGLLVIRARLTEETGISVEDYARVESHDPESMAAPLALSVPAPSLFVTTGGSAELRATISNRTCLDVPVDIAAVTPVEFWEHVRPGSRRLTLGPHETRLVPFLVHWPRNQPSGETFVLIRACGAGQLLYAPAVRIAPATERAVVIARRPACLLRFGPTPLEGEYASRQPIPPGTTVGLRLPPRFASRAVHRTIQQGEDGIHRLRFRFDLISPPRRTPQQCPIQIAVREPARPLLRTELSPRVPPLLEAVAVPSALDAEALLDGLPGAEWVAAQRGHSPALPGRRSLDEESLGAEPSSELPPADSVLASHSARDRSASHPANSGGSAGQKSPLRMQVGWDSRHLYIAAELASAVPFNDSEGPGIVTGDCLRVAFDPVATDPPRGSIGDLFELAAALARGRPAWWCFTAPQRGPTGQIDGVQMAVERRRGRTRFGLVLRCSVLGLDRLRAGRRHGFSFSGTWCDEHSKRHVVEWSEGLAYGRDASLFGTLLLTRE